MRLDPEARRARRHQTCWRAAGELARRRRVLRSGIAPRKAAPAAPPPARPPPRTATARGSGRGPRTPLRLRLPQSWGGVRSSATPAGCARRWDLVFLRPWSCRRSSHYHREHRSWSPVTGGQKGGAGGASRPFGFTRCNPAEPASSLSPSPTRRRGGGCRSCHSSSRRR